MLKLMYGSQGESSWCISYHGMCVVCVCVHVYTLTTCTHVGTATSFGFSLIKLTFWTPCELLADMHFPPQDSPSVSDHDSLCNCG